MYGMDSRIALKGVMTALVTPFRNAEVDWDALNRLVDRQIAAGADWLVPLGTTGESPTLTQSERDKLLAAVLDRTDGRRPILAGTGCNDTAATIDRTRRAAQAGADAVMLVTPYYNRPTAEGLYRHFAAVAEAVDVPIVLYNVPGRCGVCLDHDVVGRLRQSYGNIVAIKDATGRVENATALTARCDITVLCGDDALTYPFLTLGAAGVISVIANLTPSLLKSLVTAVVGGDMARAESLHRRLHDLATELGRWGPNPIPIKTAMAIAGLIEEEFRLPLCPLEGEPRRAIETLLRRHELVRGDSRA